MRYSPLSKTSRSRIRIVYACAVVDGRIFIVRNLYTTMDYTRYGTLVVELNRSKVFQDVDTGLLDDMVVCFGSRDAGTFAKNRDGEE